MQAREYCGSVGIKHKPIILSHHMMSLSTSKANQSYMPSPAPSEDGFEGWSSQDVQERSRFCRFHGGPQVCEFRVFGAKVDFRTHQKMSDARSPTQPAHVPWQAWQRYGRAEKFLEP